MLSSFYHRIRAKFVFSLRRRIKNNIVVIESDDWGLERALTQEALRWAALKYGRENFSRWTTDALESPEDLCLLFEILDKYKDQFDFPPIITANFITHNIDLSNEGKLSFRPLTAGFHPEMEDVRKLYLEGIKQNFIFPQLHGFCHYNPQELENFVLSEEAIEAFRVGFGLVKTTIKGNLSFLHGEITTQNPYVQKHLLMAASTFEKFFGFKSTTFIPPTYLFDIKFMGLLKKINVKYLQAGNRLTDSNKRRYFFPPLRKVKGVVWGIRNARLDPHPDYGYNHENTLNSIKVAFDHHLPAIIDFHRVNFSGRYNKSYRDRTLYELDKLLLGIKKNWPDACFLTSDQLLNLL